MRRAREVLEEAKAAGVRPNAVMYTSLLNAYGRAGQLQSAADVFREMQQDGVQPPARAYTSLMYWCAPSLQWAVAPLVPWLPTQEQSKFCAAHRWSAVQEARFPAVVM